MTTNSELIEMLAKEENCGGCSNPSTVNFCPDECELRDSRYKMLMFGKKPYGFFRLVKNSNRHSGYDRIEVDRYGKILDKEWLIRNGLCPRCESPETIIEYESSEDGKIKKCARCKHWIGVA